MEPNMLGPELKRHDQQNEGVESWQGQLGNSLPVTSAAIESILNPLAEFSAICCDQNHLIKITLDDKIQRTTTTRAIFVYLNSLKERLFYNLFLWPLNQKINNIERK